jgi:hypothetical protein
MYLVALCLQILIKNMKRNLNIVIFQLILFSFLSSCKDFSVPPVSVLTFALSGNLELKADAAGSPADSAVFISSLRIDANSNADFFSNRSKMTELELEKLRYQVKEVAAGTADSLIEARFEFLNPATGQFEILAEDLNRKLYQGLEVQIPLQAEARQRLIGILKSSSPAFEIRMKGKMDKRPINLIIAPQFQLSLKVKI